MVIRDLTLRSAASFGSFHLIRLLYDEYMFYIVEHKIAAAMQETSIAVMANYRQVLWRFTCNPVQNNDSDWIYAFSAKLHLCHGLY